MSVLTSFPGALSLVCLPSWLSCQNGETALMRACGNGRYAIVVKLLELGADKYLMDKVTVNLKTC